MPKPINTIYRETGLKIQMFRKQQLLTQRQLAKLAGISFVYIGYIEQGREKPSDKLMQKIRKILGF